MLLKILHVFAIPRVYLISMQIAQLFQLLKIVLYIIDLTFNMAQIICYSLYVIKVMRNL